MFGVGTVIDIIGEKYHEMQNGLLSLGKLDDQIFQAEVQYRPIFIGA